MPEGPINVEPEQAAVIDVETTYDEAEAVEKQKTGLTDIPPGTTAHFPTPAPRLTNGGQKTLNALRPKR